MILNNNPNQHGEVFVTNDGAADLDLGHYERFTGVFSTKHDNITAGSVYQNVIKNEEKENAWKYCSGYSHN